MLKSITLAASLALLGLSAAHAQDNTAVCDQAGMQQLMSTISAEGTAANKEAAQKHYALAETSMKAGNLDECAMHMGEARKALSAG